jgi:hypothetical protein
LGFFAHPPSCHAGHEGVLFALFFTLVKEPLVTESLDKVDIEELMRAQTALKNQLHALLHQYYGNAYKQSFKEIFTQKAIEWYRSDLRKAKTYSMPDNRRFVSGSILRRFKRLEVIMRQAKELLALISTAGGRLASVQKLTNALNGCGVLTGVKIVVEIGDVRRFQTEAKLATLLLDSGVLCCNLASGS